MTDNYWDNLMGDDEHAADYMRSYGEGPGSPLRHYIGSIRNNGESILDVGCGPGWNFDHFIEYGPHGKYKGIDYSERFVRVANKRWNEGTTVGKMVGAQYYPHFFIGDARDLKEPDKSWDIVLMQDVLEHTNGYDKPLQEALRVARKRIIVTFWHLMDKDEDNPVNDDGNDGWGAWYSKPKWEKHLDSLNLHWLGDEIERQGKEKHWIYIIDLEEKHGE